MANRAGLRKVVKTVRGKHGAVRRSYWVKAGEATKGFVKRHKGKIAAGALLAAGIMAANFFGDRNHGASRRAAVGSAASGTAAGARKVGSFVSGGIGQGLNAVVGAGRSVVTAASNSNMAQNLAYHTRSDRYSHGEAERVRRGESQGTLANIAHGIKYHTGFGRNTEFQNNQAASMLWGGRSFNQAVNFTPQRNQGFSGSTLHVGGNTGTSLSQSHAAQYGGAVHLSASRADSGYSMGPVQTVRGYGPTSRRGSPVARRLGLSG